MIKIIFDNNKIEVEKGVYLLKIAQTLGIYIPTLCYHESLEPYGACRICVVEVNDGRRTRLVTSCNFPAKDGIIVQTNSARVKQSQKILLELLLARSSDVKELKELAFKLGTDLDYSMFAKEKEKCILCGLCVRVCDQIIGAKAINFVSRGVDRKVATPFLEPSSTCIGCGACVFVCPTGAIKMEDIKGMRNLENWKTKISLIKCRMCENYFASELQFNEILDKIKVKADYLNLCGNCRRDDLVKELANLK